MDISLAMPLGNFTLDLTNINNLNAEIFSGNTSYATFSQVGDSDHLALPMGTYFAAGNYTLQIGGTATGSGSPAGFYNVAAVTAPVPEPETWGMLLAGVGLIGLRMRQRRRASRQAANGDRLICRVAVSEALKRRPCRRFFLALSPLRVVPREVLTTWA